MAETKTTRLGHSILGTCGLDPDDSYHRADLILKTYRKVVWSVKCHLDDLNHQILEKGEQDYSAGLCYLSEFAPNTVKEDFVSKVCCVMETRQLMEVVEQAILFVREYPEHGALYYDILYKTYLVKYPYSEAELLEDLQMSRNTYFRRKKEAEYVFAIALFGYTLPPLISAFGK